MSVPYLSRIWLNPLRRGGQRLLTDPHAVHAAVLGGLSRQPADERTLWRLETQPHRGTLLVLTQSRPSWEHVVEQAGWADADEPQALVRDYAPLLSRVCVGREFAFRLRANTVRSSKRPAVTSAAQRERLAQGGSRGQLVPERTAAHQLAWFADRLPQWGFDVVEREESAQLRLAARASVDFRKGRDGERRRVVLETAVAEGVVRVADTERAVSALLNGCGRARAYGCGLLTLAPVGG